jgi:hypothetical protein
MREMKSLKLPNKVGDFSLLVMLRQGLLGAYDCVNLCLAKHRCELFIQFLKHCRMFILLLNPE